MTGPEDEKKAVAAGRGHMRASHADRDRVITVLKVAFVQGRLDKDEFDARVHRTYTARTYAELAGITADLPDGLINVPLPAAPGPAPAPEPEEPTRMPVPVGIAGCVALVVALLCIPGAFLVDNFGVLVLGVFFTLLASPLAGGLLIQMWKDKHQGRMLPPRGTDDRQALDTGPDGTSDDGLILAVARDGTSIRQRRGLSAPRQETWRAVSSNTKSVVPPLVSVSVPVNSTVTVCPA
jgi:Domain of unknown function (DUF1707)